MSNLQGKNMEIKPSIYDKSIDEIKTLIETIESHQKEQFTPKEIINLLSGICVLKRQNADLLQELSSQVHYVEDIRWHLNHLINLYNEQKSNVERK